MNYEQSCEFTNMVAKFRIGLVDWFSALPLREQIGFWRAWNPMNEALENFVNEMITDVQDAPDWTRN